MGQMQKPFGYSRIIKTEQEMNNNWVYIQSGDFFKKQAEKNKRYSSDLQRDRNKELK
jgi:ketol-acid reductoisomerase